MGHRSRALELRADVRGSHPGRQCPCDSILVSRLNSPLGLGRLAFEVVRSVKEGDFQALAANGPGNADDELAWGLEYAPKVHLDLFLEGHHLFTPARSKDAAASKQPSIRGGSPSSECRRPS